MNTIGYHCGKHLYHSVSCIAFILKIVKHKNENRELKSDFILFSVLKVKYSMFWR